MIKTFLLVLVLLLFVTTTEAQSWTSVSQIPSQTSIWTISVVDQNIIWVAGQPAYLYLSIDGGQTWRLRNVGFSGSIWAVSALDSMNCWIGTGTGSVYHTSNSGISWALQIADTGSFINGIKMFDANNGVFYGDPPDSGLPYQFRYTTDGGNTWYLAPNAPIAGNEYGIINAWDWTDKNHFWIGVHNATSSAQTANIYYTTTGFTGIFDSASVNGTGKQNGLSWRGIAFTDSLHGMAGSTSGDVVRTTDGGKTWSETNPPLVGYLFTENMNALKDGSNLVRISILDSSNHCHIFKTTDFGNTWKEDSIPSEVATHGINVMQFLNDNLGYGAGLKGYFYKYTTGTSVVSTDNTYPINYSLLQNFPNPFNPTTTITFSVTKANLISIKVYDILGREVATLVHEYKKAGKYRIEFSAGNLPSGIYFYRLKAGNYTAVKKMLLLK